MLHHDFADSPDGLPPRSPAPAYQRARVAFARLPFFPLEVASATSIGRLGTLAVDHRNAGLGLSTGGDSHLATYDPAGNRLTRTDPETGAVTTNTYDAANRLLTSSDANGATTFTYDANGNQLTIEQPTGDVTTNTWDGENRLVQVEHPDGSITTYAYNADGLKVEADDGTEAKHPQSTAISRAGRAGDDGGL